MHAFIGDKDSMDTRHWHLPQNACFEGVEAGQICLGLHSLMCVRMCEGTLERRTKGDFKAMLKTSE